MKVGLNTYVRMITFQSENLHKKLEVQTSLKNSRELRELSSSTLQFAWKENLVGR